MLELKIGDYTVQVKARETTNFRNKRFNKLDTINFLNELSIFLDSTINGEAIENRRSKMMNDIYTSLEELGVYDNLEEE